MARDVEGLVINDVAQMTVELNEFQNKYRNRVSDFKYPTTHKRNTGRWKFEPEFISSYVCFMGKRC
jgi:hypothetical protein